MQVVPFNNLEELSPYADAWDRLAAGVPFRSWTWLSTWWRHYGPPTPQPGRRELAVLCVFDDGDALVGVAPWYWEAHVAYGGVLKMLGTGEVCSDYLTVLSGHGYEDDVALALAEFLTEEDFPASWDLLALSGIDEQDRPLQRLGAELSLRGCSVHTRSTVSCWRIDLPTQWETYAETLSKKFRSEVRQLERKYFVSGKAVLSAIDGVDQSSWTLDLLMDLHQRRRQSLGERGCYASPRFRAFIREVIPQMMRQGQVQLLRLEIEGRPAAAEIQLVGGGVLYAYQTGIDPDLKKFQPGKLTNLASIRRAIAQGYRAFDFLRGDEPYKAHFRAAPRPSLEIRMIPDRFVPQWRHRLWRAGVSVKRLFRQAHLVK